jgi:hypothetical protein
MLKNTFNKVKKLCTPAFVYFVISIVALIIMMINNGGNTDKFCLGKYDCPVQNVWMIYLIKLVYILFITIVLDSLCKNGFAPISWFLVFFPIVLFFVALGLFMIGQNSMNNKFEYADEMKGVEMFRAF